MGEVKVTILGDHEAWDLAARLKLAGDGRLRRRLYDSIRRSNDEAGPILRMSALATLPKRGGLAAAVAEAHINVRATMTADEAGVVIEASHQYDLEGLDRGLNIHPWWGNKRHWSLQKVRSGWFTDPLRLLNHTTTKAMLDRTCEAFAKELEG